MNLILFVLRLPWFAYPILACGVVYLGMQMEGHYDKRAAVFREAIASDPPPVVDLDQYSFTRQEFNEGTFRAQIVSNETTRLIDRKNGIETGEDIMVVLADPAAKQGLKEFRGLMILSTSEFERFPDWAMERVVGIGEIGPIIEFSASVSSSNTEGSHARDALKDRDGALRDDAIYIAPYITKTREAYLTQRLESAKNGRGNINAIAFLIAFFGIVKLIIERQLRTWRPRSSAAVETMT